MAQKITLDDLAAMMEKGFSAVAEDISEIKETMATKEDISRLDGRIDGLTIKVDAIQKTLDNDALVRSDQKLLERVSAVEKHLGLDHHIPV